MTKYTHMKKQILVSLLSLVALAAPAQEVLTLEDCRDMAVRQSQDLEQARIKMEMAGYDRKIALANYFPKVSASGAYLYNDRDIALTNSDQSMLLQNAGTLMQARMNAAMSQAAGRLSAAMQQKMTQLMTAIQTNPALAAEYMGSPMWQTILGMLKETDPASLAGLMPNVADPINAIGKSIDDSMHPDLHNIWVGIICGAMRCPFPSEYESSSRT